MATHSNEDIWRVLLSRLAPDARIRVEKLFPTAGPPLFFPFVLEAVERDVALGRVSTGSGPLLDSGLLVHALSEPLLLEIPEAIRLASAAVKLDYRLDDKLLTSLDPLKLNESKAARVFEIIDSISDCQRLVLPLMKFLKLPRHQLRSKVVKLISRGRRNPGWAKAILGDPDPRVRSNLIDGLAEQKGNEIDALLRKGAADPHHRVAVTALLQLCLRGDQSSCERICQLAREGDAPHRRAAEWALAKLEGAKLAPHHPAMAAESGPSANSLLDETQPIESATRLAQPAS